MSKLYLFLFLFVFISEFVSAQSNRITEKDKYSNIFITTSIGYQMSGIKSEDFVKSNYSPLLKIGIGKWISPEIALKVGYQGLYFNAISDTRRHYYNYIFGEVILNLNSLIVKDKKTLYSALLHVGSGYFYNFDYNQPNILASFGLSNSLHISENFSLNLEVSALMGWDIYQGDEDILPGIGLGIIYTF